MLRYCYRTHYKRDGLLFRPTSRDTKSELFSQYLHIVRHQVQGTIATSGSKGLRSYSIYVIVGINVPSK